MSQVDRLAAMLARLQRDVADLQRAPQLQNSGIEGTIPIYDPNDPRRPPVGAIGQLPDGTWGVGIYTGPVPPPPTTPTLTPVPGGLAVAWDGGFVHPETGEPVPVPMDFTRVEVHLYEVAGGYDPVYTPFATIESPRGGQVNVVPLVAGRRFYCVLVTRNTSGGASIPSGEATAIAASFVSDEEIAAIAADLEDNKTQLADNATRLEANTADLAALETSLQENTTQLAATKGIAEAARTTADGKGRVWFQTTAPTATSVYDIWFDTDDENKPYQWNGSAWVAQPLGNAAIGNLTAAKITFGTMSGDRIQVGTLVGDRIVANTINGDRIIANTLQGDRIIANTFNGDRIIANTINGDRIIANTLNANKIIGNTITGDKIAANEIVGVHIRSREIGADKIVGGSITAFEIASSQIQAHHIASDAITSKIITAGIFRTDIPGNDRVEIINEVQYDQYLGVFRNLRDTVRWLNSSNQLVGEIRGYMGDIGAHGLHLNSHVEIGNVQSVIYQVGKRSARSPNPNVRIRADRARVTLSSGAARVTFGRAFTETPTVVVAQIGYSSESRHLVQRIDNITPDGFDIGCWVVGANGAYGPVGGNPTIDVHYYAEIVV